MPSEGGNRQHLLVSSLTTDRGEVLDAGTVNVLLGVERSGKTELLRDILRLVSRFELNREDQQLRDDPQTVVLSDLTYAGNLALERLLAGLPRLPGDSQEEPRVYGLGPDLRTPVERHVAPEVKNVLYRPTLMARSTWTTPLADVMPLRVSFLDGSAVGDLLDATTGASPIQVPENVLQAFQYAPAERHSVLEAAFAETFGGRRLRLDATQQVNLSLRVADEFPPDSGDPAEQALRYAELAELSSEGSGAQSFAAVLLCCLLSEGRIVLLDRPDAHLHPTTAHKLGQWISRNAVALQQQLLIAPASMDLVRGLFHANSDVTIMRLQRNEEGESSAQVVPPDTGRSLARHPLLAPQRALDALEFESVVVVMDETERLIYESIAHQMPGGDKIFFLVAHHVRYLSVIAQALRKAGMPTCVVARFELFAEEEAFVTLVEAVAGRQMEQSWLATRERLAQKVEQAFGGKQSSTRDMEQFLDKMKEGPSGGKDRPQVASDEEQNAWHRFEAARLEVLPPELRVWVEELLEDLKREGVFVSSRGLALSWLKSTPADPAPTLTQAIQLLQNGQLPADLRAFVADLVSHAQTKKLPSRAARTRQGTA